MFLKCLLFLFILAEISAAWTPPCRTPSLKNGRVSRTRQRSKLIRFICSPGFYLVGNKYATCREGEWDVQIPVCVKPGCRVPIIENGLPLISHNGAWLIFFCYPSYKLQGSPALYCDGKRWNDTAPTCDDTTDVTPLSCNFEDSDLCGWSQDEMHDFDWRRINRKTPSSFLFTGPQHDHTYGKNGNGYYMYIESTSRLENETARLISPVYDSHLTDTGCFSFYYHMFGKTTGGLKVYQKSVNESLSSASTLFEKWGNQGDAWYSGVVALKKVSEDFQIVMEGIRGSGFTSDIAIDDVAILVGDNCTAARAEATTPAQIIPDSCEGRCDLGSSRADAKPLQPGQCGCSVASCMQDFDCCPDFFDVCISFDSPSPEQPQTEKLIAESTTELYRETSVKYMTPYSESFGPPTRPGSTYPPPPAKTTTPKTTTSKTTSPKTTTSKTTSPKIIPSTPPKPTKRPNFSTTPLPTTKKVQVITTAKPAERKTTIHTRTTNWGPQSSRKPTTESRRVYYNDKLKAEKEQKIETEVSKFTSKDKTSKSSGLKTTLLVITGLALMLGAIYLAVWSRGPQGRNALARLTGRVRHDPDVQYLHSAEEHSD